MDLQINIAQTHMNSRYGSLPGWTPLIEDGVSGWNTMYGLRKALQAELGIANLATGFGSTTRKAYEEQIGTISAATPATTNVRQILNWSLWCKGQTAVYDSEVAPVLVSYASVSGPLMAVQAQLGLTANGEVNVKLMLFMLSMDSHRLINQGGSARIREVQQWINSVYSTRRDFEVVPADGIVTRSTQTALLLALQYELGMADGVANGNFGPGTRSGLRSVTVQPGATDGANRYVRILKAAMLFNELVVEWTSIYDAPTQDVLTVFQSFMELTVSTTVDYGTWCALLVSSGDPDRPTTGLDTRIQLREDQYRDLAERGYTHVGRYVTNIGAFLTAAEIDSVRATDVSLIPLFQRNNNSVADMTYNKGYTQGSDAIARGRVLGLPAGSVIYAAADHDFVGEVVTRNVMDFFEGFRDALKVAVYSFTVGAYGPRLVYRELSSRNISQSFFISASSTGFSGNIGVPMPSAWDFMQIAVDRYMPIGGNRTVYDAVVVSKSAPVIVGSEIAGPVPQRYGDDVESGFDPIFTWIVVAELHLQRNLPITANPWSSETAMALICNYLRKEKYNSPTWNLFFANVGNAFEVPTLEHLGTAEVLLAAMLPADTAYDVDHFAATHLGYYAWGTSYPGVVAGDMGGWLLDLMSLFSGIAVSDSPADVEDFVSDNVGGSSGHFGWKDLLADVDAYLLARLQLEMGIHSVAADSCRLVWRRPPHERVSLFFEMLFGGTVSGVEAYMGWFYPVADVQIGELGLSPRLMIMDQAEIEVWPTREQVLGAARGFARALARMSLASEWT